MVPRHELPGRPAIGNQIEEITRFAGQFQVRNIPRAFRSLDPLLNLPHRVSGTGRGSPCRDDHGDDVVSNGTLL